jgi:hypothetical protein
VRKEENPFFRYFSLQGLQIFKEKSLLTIGATIATFVIIYYVAGLFLLDLSVDRSGFFLFMMPIFAFDRGALFSPAHCQNYCGINATGVFFLLFYYSTLLYAALFYFLTNAARKVLGGFVALLALIFIFLALSQPHGAPIGLL